MRKYCPTYILLEKEIMKAINKNDGKARVCVCIHLFIIIFSIVFVKLTIFLSKRTSVG